MVQLSILVRSQNPVQAIQTGKDTLICGDCPVRPYCYVQTGKMPLAIWRAVKGQRIQSGYKAYGGSKPIRLGAYGDPAFLPYALLSKLAKHRKHTGYTHQWRTCHTAYAKYLMASVETPQQATAAQGKGYRTYRILPSTDTPLMADEILCPNYTHGVLCADCGLCNGTTGGAKNIAIPAHGNRKGLAAK